MCDSGQALSSFELSKSKVPQRKTTRLLVHVLARFLLVPLLTLVPKMVLLTINRVGGDIGDTSETALLCLLSGLAMVDPLWYIQNTLRMRTSAKK